jgi:hypothetical protein
MRAEAILANKKGATIFTITHLFCLYSLLAPNLCGEVRKGVVSGKSIIILLAQGR